LYGRVTDAKVTRLVEEAATAHFNCLRIWGGGRYETDAFYDACDRLGILVWHDFMSACAPLPAHEPWFVSEFMAEARHQVRRLYNRTCLLLWCGNNEVSSCYGWLWNDLEEDDPGWRLYHQLLPRMMHELAPHIPYWPSSPYGGDRAGHGLVGDCHHWTVMSEDSKDWSDPAHWDTPEIPIFNSEYGYGGPCCLASTKEYLGTETPDLFSEEGREHTNAFYDIPRVNFSIGEHYEPPEGLPLERYILLGGLCQGLNLGYSLEAQRANRQTWGGIFWMYNDTWGENGWTVIDYYLRRKVSYYNVKRCLAHRHLLIRRGGQAFGGSEDEILLIVLNDTANTLGSRVRFGYSAWDGSEQALDDVAVEVAPRSRKTVARCAVPDAARLAQGTVVVCPEPGSGLRSAWWWQGPYRKNPPPPTTVAVERVEHDGDESIVTLRAEGFAHAVHFMLDGDARPEDQYFDLLPRETIRLRVPGSAGRSTEDVKLRWYNMPPA
jgi:beta-mannosidase